MLTLITTHLARHLERRGLLGRDLETSHLTRAPGEDAALEILQGHSITYRIAMGPHEGRKAFTLQTVPASAHTTKLHHPPGPRCAARMAPIRALRHE